VSTKRFLLAVLGIALVGLGLRWFWILEVRPADECGPPGTEAPAGCLAISGRPDAVNDPRYVHELANLIGDGTPFVDPFTYADTGEERPSAQKMPLFPLYLGAASFVGVDGVDGHRMAAALLGAATAVVLGLVGRRLLGWRAGLIAATIGALYPNLWINDFLLQVESLAALLAALTILAAYRYRDEPTAGRILALGALIALAALTRAEALLLYAFIALPLILGAVRTLKERLTHVALAGLAAVVLIGPWVGWNLSRFDDPTTLSTGPGPVLSTASCDATYYGDQIGYYASCFDIGAYAAEEGLTVAEAEARLRDFDESERAAVASEQAQAYIRDHLGRLPVVMVARVARMWDLYRPAQNVSFNWRLEGRGERTSQLGLVSYYVLAGLAVYGLVELRRRRLPLSPLLGMAAMITVTAAWTFGTTRYRVPADVAIVIAAAVAVEALLRRRWPLEDEVGDGDRDGDGRSGVAADDTNPSEDDAAPVEVP
jgi:4-amino-4-deoxy-L-arabinose transferase-like glycosyltransferase